LVGAAAAGVSKLPGELTEILQLIAAHGADAVLAALQRAVEFRRWREADVRSILVLTVPTRPLSAYKINTSEGASQ
jgi:hypothetical protein